MVNKNNFKVFIPTAGLGSRLGEKTKYRNKVLVDIGNVPAIKKSFKTIQRKLNL